MAIAIIASVNQIVRNDPGYLITATAAAKADRPIAIPPEPGTAVNDPARSIVSRMNRRLSIAWSCKRIGCEREAMRGLYGELLFIASTLLCRVSVRGPYSGPAQWNSLERPLEHPAQST